MKNRKRNNAGYLLLEYAITFPILLVLLVMFLYVILLCGLKAQMNSAAQQTVVYVKYLCSSNYNAEEFPTDLSGGLPELGLENSELYNVYTNLFNGGSKQMKILNENKAIEKIYKYYLGTPLLNLKTSGSGDDGITVESKVTNYIVFTQLELTVSCEIKSPINFSFIGAEGLNKLKITVNEKGVIKDNAETVRSFQLLDYILRRTGLSEKINETIDNMLTTVKGWFGMGGSGNSSTSGGSGGGNTSSSENSDDDEGGSGPKNQIIQTPDEDSDDEESGPKNQIIQIPDEDSDDEESEPKNQIIQIPDEDTDDEENEPKNQIIQAPDGGLVGYDTPYLDDEEEEEENQKFAWLSDNNTGLSDDVLEYIDQNVPANFKNDVANAFESNAKVYTYKKDTIVYRYYGGGSSERSYWYTTEYIETSDEAREKLALPDGNTAELVMAYVIPAGTTVIMGTVSENFGQKGGGTQIYVPNPDALKTKWASVPD